MKNILPSIALSLIFLFSFNGAIAQNDTEVLTSIPEIPASITSPMERCNYVVYHYWDHFNYKSAFSAKKRMNNTLGRFLDFVPCASADTVYIAIDELIKGVAKTKPDNLVELCKMAESWTQSDSAEYYSDDLYYPFIKAVATNKKIKNPEKARYQAQYKIMTNSRLGTIVQQLPFTRPDGTKANIADITAPHVLLMFIDPDCIDCSLAKIRLSADFVVEALVKNKILDIVAIYPGDPNDAEWLSYATTLPKNWISGAMTDAESLFDIPSTPTIYYLNQERKVAAKNVTTDKILTAFHQLVESSSQQHADEAEQPSQNTPSDKQD